MIPPSILLTILISVATIIKETLDNENK